MWHDHGHTRTWLWRQSIRRLRLLSLWLYSQNAATTVDTHERGNSYGIGTFHPDSRPVWPGLAGNRRPYADVVDYENQLPPMVLEGQARGVTVRSRHRCSKWGDTRKGSFVFRSGSRSQEREPILVSNADKYFCRHRVRDIGSRCEESEEFMWDLRITSAECAGRRHWAGRHRRHRCDCHRSRRHRRVSDELH